MTKLMFHKSIVITILFITVVKMIEMCSGEPLQTKDYTINGKDFWDESESLKVRRNLRAPIGEKSLRRRLEILYKIEEELFWPPDLEAYKKMKRRLGRKNQNTEN